MSVHVRAAVAVIGMLAVCAVCVQPALAYLKFGIEIDGKQVVLRWKSPAVRYFVTDRGVSGVTAADLQAAVARAFATWEAVPSAAISYQFGGYTASLPGDDDGRS